MKQLIDIVNESDLKMPRYITVQKPDNWKSTVRIETIPEIAWAHMYYLNQYDELNWQRHIPGETSAGKTLAHEEGNYIYFLIEDPNGKTWDLTGIYNLKEETLYIDTLLRNFESWMGNRFSVTMKETEF